MFSRALRVAGCLLLGAFLGLESCDYVPSDLAPIGVARSDAGDVILRFYTCPDELIKRISVLYSPDGVVGNEDDDVYWEITSDGAHSSEFIVGEAPPGFTQRVELTRNLPATASLSAEVETTDLSGIIEDFELRDLPTQGVEVKGDILTESEFKARALDRCRE